MQARVCVQTYDNGDIQGFLYLDEGMGESLVTTTARFAAGSASASYFMFSGTKGEITARATVDVDGRSVDFSIDLGSGMSMTTSNFSRPLAVSSSPC